MREEILPSAHHHVSARWQVVKDRTYEVIHNILYGISIHTSPKIAMKIFRPKIKGLNPKILAND